MNIESTKRFSGRAEHYLKSRPRYPDGIIDLLVHRFGLAPHHVIADVGSGTGFLAELFLRNKNRVFAVEPNQEMRDAGEKYLRDYENFISVTGTAENSTLRDGSIDFITAGQAFHWFHVACARREFMRILKPDGWVVLVWNDRQVETAFGRAFEQLLREYCPQYDGKHRTSHRDESRHFFGQPCAEYVFVNQQFLAAGEFAGRVLSASYAPQKCEAAYPLFLSALQAVFQQFQENGRVRIDYLTRVYPSRFTRAI